MKETVEFQRSPPLDKWVDVLIKQGWKITTHKNNFIKAKKEIGQSKYPTSLIISWYLTINTQAAETIIHIDVPSFAESIYSKDRIYSEICKFCKHIDGDCQTEIDLSIDLLSELREDNI